jgi:hypothetical protein
MKEKTLRDYLDNKVTVDILALDVRDSQKKTSYDVISVFVDKTNETGEYEITKDHLIKLLDDTITGRLTTTDLNTIAFALIGSEYFTWDKDDKVIDDTIFELDNPDIGFPLTVENLRRWRNYLETGEYTFDTSELKRRELKRAR